MFDKLLLAVPGVPILVLAGAKDAEIGLEALRRGAKDYLLQDHLDRDSFVLAIRNMTVRNSAEEMSYLKQEHAHFTLSSIRDAVLNPDIECTVTYVSHVSGKSSVRSGNYCTQIQISHL
jgi:DNA-binding NarL/FixJ family response regulator